MRVLLLSLLFFAFLGCDGPASEKLIPKPKFEKKVFKGEVRGQEFRPQVDILFVVDDSGSMTQHQQNLSNGMSTFIQGLNTSSFLDYHFGVITTSLDYSSYNRSGGGALVGNPAYVDKNTPNGLEALRNNVLVGTGGDTTEIHFETIKLALSPLHTSSGGRNFGFFRPKAHLAIIFLTDTEDQGNKKNGAGPVQLYDFLLNLKGGNSDLILGYGAIVPPNTSADCRRDPPEPFRILEFLNLVEGGNYFSLCDPSFGTKLAMLANDIVDKVGRYFYLREAPVPETIEVKVGNRVVPSDPIVGWTYDPTRNAIYFGDEFTLNDDEADAKLQVNFVTGTFEIDPNDQPK